MFNDYCLIIISQKILIIQIKNKNYKNGEKQYGCLRRFYENAYVADIPLHQDYDN